MRYQVGDILEVDDLHRVLEVVAQDKNVFELVSRGKHGTRRMWMTEIELMQMGYKVTPAEQEAVRHYKDLSKFFQKVRLARLVLANVAPPQRWSLP